jgi:hypothetical protein
VSYALATSGYTAAPTVAAIATGVWQDTTAGDFTVAGSIGKSLFTSGAVPGAAVAVHCRDQRGHYHYHGPDDYLYGQP